MSEHEIDPLEPELRAILEVERSQPDMPREAAERVLKRVEATAGLGDEGARERGVAGDEARSVERGFLARRLPFGMAMFVLGGLTGAGLYATLQPRTHPVVVAPRAPQTALSPMVPAIDPAPIARPAPTPPVPTVAPTPAPATAPVPPGSRPPTPAGGAGRDTDLAAERALLEVARTALSRGQVDAALEATQRHARRFPRGQLAEERESVWIQALVAADRPAEARQRAAEFRRRFPRSMLRPVVEAAVRSNP